ncbi:hypothetical protein C8F04DRAFT_1190463 [Mycena alexandri]|uniref:Uncharacterized protein n=1 Tax=Mycena alexandri TaxID=1745969 RepID=A0AAD6SEK6_9AGAR|nr:hypothetical protein C8F04DRAFT_1190463 [Mycena alexandri]
MRLSTLGGEYEGLTAGGRGGGDCQDAKDEGGRECGGEELEGMRLSTLGGEYEGLTAGGRGGGDCQDAKDEGGRECGGEELEGMRLSTLGGEYEGLTAGGRGGGDCQDAKDEGGRECGGEELEGELHGREEKMGKRDVTSVRQVIAYSPAIHIFWAEDLDRQSPTPKAEFEFEVQQFNMFSYDDLFSIVLGKGKVPLPLPPWRQLAAVLAALWRQSCGGTFKIINKGKGMLLPSEIQLYLQHLKLAWRTEWRQRWRQSGGKFCGGGNVGGKAGGSAGGSAGITGGNVDGSRGDIVTCWRT